MATTEIRETETEVLTVDEAASILRTSRNAAYALTRQWRATGGQVGLPCIELGRSIRVPRAALLHLLTTASSPPAAPEQSLPHQETR